MECHFLTDMHRHTIAAGLMLHSYRSHQSQPTLFPLAAIDQALCLPRRTMGVAVAKIRWVKLEPAVTEINHTVTTCEPNTLNF